MVDDMDTELLSRIQFGTTTVYHFFFVPISIGLSGFVAGFQTAWTRTDKTTYLKLTRFFGTLLLINFVVGIATGLVQEFQFGMNWSEFSRFVGDIFGAPLALEGLLAFFLESTFLGLWTFGWNRLPKKVHLLCIWMVAVSTTISAYFILTANSFMQNPVGYRYNAELGRAELVDFGAVLTNPVVLITLPHTIFACYLVGAALVIAAAGWNLVQQARRDRTGRAAATPEQPYVRDAEGEERRSAFRTAVKVGAVGLLICGAGTFVTGDIQGKVMTDVQPMKMAAAEALYETERPAAFSIITIGTLDGKHEVWSIKVPRVLSFLATGTVDGEVKGVNELQADYQERFGPGDYAPYIPITYWTFRAMMGLGIVAFGTGALILWLLRRDRDPAVTGFWGLVWRIGPPLLPLVPLFACAFGWIFTEMGRQPWLAHTLMKTSAGVSPNLSPAEVWASLTVFTVLYGVLAVIEVRLLMRAITKGLPDIDAEPVSEDEEQPLSYGF